MASTWYHKAGLSVDVVGAEEVADYILTMPEEDFPAVKEVFKDSVVRAANEIKKMKKMKIRTGSLKRSIQQGVRGKSIETLGASVWSGSGYGGREVLYAPMQEFGGTIRAKSAYSNVPGGPYLNIPIADNLTMAGVTRESAKSVFQSGQGRIIKSKRGKYLVFKGQSLMFVLVKEVTLKPRLGMRKAADAEIPRLLENLQQVIGEE